MADEVQLDYGVLYLRKEGIKAVNFLLFFYKRIVLRYTAKSELIHQIDLIWFVQVFVLKAVNEIIFIWDYRIVP